MHACSPCTPTHTHTHIPAFARTHRWPVKTWLCVGLSSTRAAPPTSSSSTCPPLSMDCYTNRASFPALEYFSMARFLCSSGREGEEVQFRRLDFRLFAPPYSAGWQLFPRYCLVVAVLLLLFLKERFYTEIRSVSEQHHRHSPSSI